MDDPLRNVNLRPPTAKGPEGTLSKEQIDQFQQFNQESAAAQQRATAVDDEPEPQQTEVKPDPLSAEELKSLSEMQMLLMRSEELQLQDNIDRIRTAERTVKRNKRIAKSLPDVKLSELLLKDFIAMEIHISADYVVVFRTVNNHVSVDASEVAREILDAAPKTAEVPLNATYMIQLANLACGLVKIGDVMLAAHEIHKIKPGETEVRRSRIREALDRLRNYPDSFLEDLISIQTLFNAHVRKGIQTEGFVESEVGKY